MGRIENARGFLGRLAQDDRGNVIAIMAAAMLPLAGLIGGGVDMSRLYLTKMRLQQACDAGALAGRRAMGANNWTSGTEETAGRLFSANFSAGNYGTIALNKNYSEANGVVTGTAEVTVPMTIMKVFGITSRPLSVRCTSKMELPNTDVMFVLDMTYSMQSQPSCTTDYCSGAAVGTRRIDGLKKATKCFYEALMKVATSEPCTYNSSTSSWSSTGDPVATTASTTAQVRIGFVPYGVNVNVGRILPNSVMADNWVYESREAASLGIAYGWTLGTQTAITWGAVSATPDHYSNGGTTYYNSSFATVSGSDTTTFTMADGTVHKKKNTSPTNSTQCNNLNTYGSYNQLVGIQENLGSWGTTTSNPTDQNPPVHPATTQNIGSSRSRTNNVTWAYKYVWTSNACWLQRASAKTSGNIDDYPQTQSGTSTKPITWTTYDNVVTSWNYRPRTLSVASLKNGGSTWNSSVTFPLIASTRVTNVTRSGQSTAADLYYASDLTASWDGCIEEAQTFQNTGGSISTEWGTLPAAALDANVNLIPNAMTSGSYWGPMLSKTSSSLTTFNSPVWARYTGSTTTAWQKANQTSTAAAGLTQDNYEYVCTTAPARKLAVYSTASDFVSYVDGLVADDIGTYHDIGLLWGGRLISPLGIFANENATASAGGAIQRHLIFMTDGNTRSFRTNYNAYGLSGVSQKQFNKYPTEAETDELINARLLNICNQIKNMNIKLWVVFYGASGSTTTQDRLRTCATAPASTYYVLASDTAALTSKFQDIAAKISELRLTS